MLAAAIMACPVPSHTGHASSQDRLRHVQVLFQDVQEQELVGLSHVEVPQGREGPAER